MHLISITGRTLGHLASANAVRIALSVMLAAPQPAAALQAIIVTLAEQLAAIVLPAGLATGTAVPARDGHAPPGLVGPGPGWG